jgi:ubiquinone/menaquinone biosynthesis C-methylase UbiE
MEISREEMNQARKQFFNEHAKSWLDMFYKNEETGQLDKHDKAFERLFSIVTLKPGNRVLDVGCGSGVLVPMVLERISPTGILYELDFAEKMIEENKNLHKAENIRFIIADAIRAPLDPESCNVVFCFSCFPHFERKEDTLISLSRILTNGGILVVAHFDSSKEINDRHKSCPAVMHDHLPEEFVMRAFFQKADLSIDLFIDEPGFYCILAHRQK